MKEFFGKHTDTIIILGGILSSFLWMNGKFNDLDRRLVRIETVIIMKGMMTGEMAMHREEK